MRRLITVSSLLLVAACCARPTPRTAAAVSSAAPVQSAAQPDDEDEAEPATSAVSSVGSAAAPSASPTASTSALASVGTVAPATSTAVPSPSAAPGGAPLPQVIVENVGLHIGGKPIKVVNAPEEKRPFLDAVAAHFDGFRACFRHAEEPTKGGTFGLDLLIGRVGGAPTVKQVRTIIKGAAFKECVVEEMGKVTFAPPKRGPTVISYSLRFRLD